MVDEGAEEVAEDFPLDGADPDAEEGIDPDDMGAGEEEEPADEDAPPVDGEDGEGEDEEEEMVEPANVDGKFVVRLRQRLKTAEQAERFIRQLLDRIESSKSAEKTLVFDDFDISENKVLAEHLASIFEAFTDEGVHVERFRAFGCPTLDDSAAYLLSDWLSRVKSENVPYEIHLSDCAITTDGFQAISNALAENDAFPAPDPKFPRRGPLALYLRLEHNFIDTKAMDKVIEDGIAVKMKKGKTPAHSDGVKMRFLVREDGNFAQKRGTPPSPEDVPDPRPVREKGMGKGSSSWSGGDRWRDHDRDRKGSGKGSWGGKDRDRRDSIRPPWQMAISAPRGAQNGASSGRGERRTDGYSRSESYSSSYPSRPETRRPLRSPEPRRREGGYSGGSGGYDSARPSSGPSSAPAPYNAFSRGGRPDDRDAGRGPRRDDGRDRGRGGGSYDSSRPAMRRPLDARDREDPYKRPRHDPPPRSFGSRDPGGRGGERSEGDRGDRGGSRPAGAGRASGGSGGGKLPHPWEEHWSDDYQMMYFWNSKSGDSQWERPRG